MDEEHDPEYFEGFLVTLNVMHKCQKGSEFGLFSL